MRNSSWAYPPSPSEEDLSLPPSKEAKEQGNGDKPESLKAKSPKDSDVDECAICFEPVTDRAITSPCNHYTFDFLCLMTWLNDNTTCPLCKAELNYVDYDFRVPDGFQRYEVKRMPPFLSVVPHLPGHGAGEWRTTDNGMVPFQGNPARDDLALIKRRHVYERKLFSCHIGVNSRSGFRNIMPGEIADSADLQSKARKFIRRELRLFDFLQPTSPNRTVNRPPSYLPNHLPNNALNYSRGHPLNHPRGYPPNYPTGILLNGRPDSLLHNPPNYPPGHPWNTLVYYPMYPPPNYPPHQPPNHPPNHPPNFPQNSTLYLPWFRDDYEDHEEHQPQSVRNPEFLLEYIVAILRTTDLKDSSGKAEDLLAEFLGRANATLFLHELGSWMRSPCQDLAEWDSLMQYKGEGESSSVETRAMGRYDAGNRGESTSSQRGTRLPTAPPRSLPVAPGSPHPVMTVPGDRRPPGMQQPEYLYVNLTPETTMTPNGELANFQIGLGRPAPEIVRNPNAGR